MRYTEQLVNKKFARYSPYSRLDLGSYITKVLGSKMDIYVQIINVFNRKNIFRKSYNVGSIYNGIDDDRDWDEDKHDANGNGEPDVGEVNVMKKMREDCR